MMHRSGFINAVLAVTFVATALSSYAFETSYFPRQGVLSSGHWIKVSVTAGGLYRIPAATLSSWGLGSASSVRIYGIAGGRMADVLTEANVPSDLQLLQNTVTADGDVVFYASDPGSWEDDGSGRFYYLPNIYSSNSYFYITANDTIAARDMESIAGAAMTQSETRADSYNCRFHHESELSSPGEAGPLLVGEDFRYTTSRSFDFTLSDAPADADIWYRISYVSAFTSGSPSLTVSVDNSDITGSTTSLSLVSSSSYIHGTENVIYNSGKLTSTDISAIRVNIQFNGASTALSALNSLTVGYNRKMSLPAAGYLTFDTPSRCCSLTTAGVGDVTLWDVTDPLNIKAVTTSTTATTLEWNAATAGRRFYAAFSSGASIPAPTFVEALANTNLHGDDCPDMVIIAPTAMLAQAQRIADYHATTADSLTSLVVDADDIYDEFSGGRAEPAGIRNYLKMLYDRGAAGEGHTLKYVTIMGRMTYDNRHLLAASGDYPTIPGWSPWSVRSSLSDNEGYFTDDYYTMLADGAAADMSADKLCIAAGRIPVTDVTEAKTVVDKELEYAKGARHSAWKQRMILLADDGDSGVHLRQSEDMAAGFTDIDGIPYIPNKIYLDAYTRSGGVYNEARDGMFSSLDEGVVWWNFIGHANTVGWTADGILSYSDINSLYLRHLPFIYAATCDFLRLDGTAVSGAELMYKERNGGCIGVISATRPVYISENGPLSAAMGRALAKRGDDGRFLTPGRMYMEAKNDIRDSRGNIVSDDNKLRYVFVGDPALRLSVPDNIVSIDTINGVPTDTDGEPPMMAAMSRSTVSGSILTPDRQPYTGFNGTVTIDIYDAESTTTTDPEDGSDPINFEVFGGRVFTGSAKVTNGKFTINVAMPTELSQNYRPASMGSYAYDDTTDDEAIGLFRGFYVYGYDEDAPADNQPPVIESMVLNHSSFNDGDIVNAAPMLIASVTDDVGINISTAGIGHQLSLTLDSTRTYNDVATYYTPNTDGTPGGVINYPFEDLTEGMHTLSLRVWDTSGNSARSTINFGVSADATPKIYDIYSDANPASTEANFYLSHDRPDAMIDVTVTVYNLLGHALWIGSASGRSDMFLSVPVTWDLTDTAGRRVGRGIYLYRATITDDGTHYDTATRKLAVTAQ